MPTDVRHSPAFLARFRILRKLGEGSMGEVLDAIQLALDRRVAVKLMRPERFGDRETRERIVGEARILSRLAHPNVVRLLDADVDGDSPYLVMELIEGITLEKLLEDKSRLAFPEAAEIGMGLLAGLAHLHAAGVLHRDLKPSNVLLEKGKVPRLVDFGLALAAGGPRLTADGYCVGTPIYMAPELLLGGEPSAASDLYAAGMTLYRMMAGDYPVPLVRGDPALQEKLALDFSALARKLPILPEPAVELLSQCLAPSIERRLASAEKAAGVLRRALGPLAATTLPIRVVTEPRRRNRPWLATLAVLLAAALAGALASWLHPWTKAGPEPAAASPRPGGGINASLAPPTPATRFPALTGISVGADRALVRLAGPAPAHATVSCRLAKAASGWTRDVEPGATRVVLEGLDEQSRYEGGFSAGAGSRPFSLETLPRQRQCGAMVLEAGMSFSDDLSVVTSGPRLAALWRRGTNDHRLRQAVLCESPDGGATWDPPVVLSGEERVGEPLSAVWTSEGLQVAWCVQGGSRLVSRFRPEGKSEWTTPTELPCLEDAAALSAAEDGSVELLYAPPGGAGDLLRWTCFKPPGLLAGPSLAAFRQSRVRWAALVHTRGKLGAFTLTGSHANEPGTLWWSAASGPGGSWLAPRQLTTVGELPRHPSALAMPGLLALAYDTEAEVVTVLASTDGGRTIVPTPPPQAEEVMGKLPVLVRNEDEALLLRARFVGLIGPKTVALTRTRDGRSWTPETRLHLWLIEPRSLAAAISGDRLVVLAVDRFEGVMAVQVPRDAWRK